MGETLVWKQTRDTITQVPVSDAVNEVSRTAQWPPERVEAELLENKRLLRIPGAKYHIWRDSLY